MFAQSIFAAAVAAVAVAYPLSARTDYKCNTGSVQCCKTTKYHESYEGDLIASLLKLDIGAITGEFGFQCSPIVNLIGGGSKCSSQTVCRRFAFPLDGLINIGL